MVSIKVSKIFDASSNLAGPANLEGNNEVF